MGRLVWLAFSFLVVGCCFVILGRARHKEALDSPLLFELKLLGENRRVILGLSPNFRIISAASPSDQSVSTQDIDTLGILGNCLPYILS